MKTYILVDTANTFFRARHTSRGDLNDRVGLSLHTLLSSVRKVWRDFKGDHVIFCLEGRSWRKDFYQPYKRNREDIRSAQTPREAEEDKIFWETFDQFKEFVINKTNTTVLHHPRLEADDLIAGWIQGHPTDQHIIVSTDGDFAQLVAPNVKQYNGVTDLLITHEGVVNNKGQKVSFTIHGPGKIKIGKEDPAFTPDQDWIQYLLFLKCMRGDPGDNVFSAYPGAREKGTKNKVGIREAFLDRNSKGYNWNNVMLQRWTDHNNVEHKVIDDYTRNQTLCDLSAQPEDVRQLINDTISTAILEEKDIPQVGIRLLKFCSEFDLQKISEQVQSYAEPLNARYSR